MRQGCHPAAKIGFKLSCHFDCTVPDHSSPLKPGSACAKPGPVYLALGGEQRPLGAVLVERENIHT